MLHLEVRPDYIFIFLGTQARLIIFKFLAARIPYLFPKTPPPESNGRPLSTYCAKPEHYYYQYGVGSRSALLITTKGALDSQPQVIKFTGWLPMVGGSLRVLRLFPPLQLVALILLKVALNTIIKYNQTDFVFVGPTRSYWF